MVVTVVGGPKANYARLEQAVEVAGFHVTHAHAAHATQPRAIGALHHEPKIKDVVELSSAFGAQPYDALAGLGIECLSDVTNVNCMDVWQVLREKGDNFNFSQLRRAMRAASISFADVPIGELDATGAVYWISRGIDNRYAVKLMRHAILGEPMLLALNGELLKSIQNLGAKAQVQIKQAQKRIRTRRRA